MVRPDHYRQAITILAMYLAMRPITLSNKAGTSSLNLGFLTATIHLSAIISLSCSSTMNCEPPTVFPFIVDDNALESWNSWTVVRSSSRWSMSDAE
jgi:hypothetical protein